MYHDNYHSTMNFYHTHSNHIYANTFGSINTTQVTQAINNNHLAINQPSIDTWWDFLRKRSISLALRSKLTVDDFNNTAKTSLNSRTFTANIHTLTYRSGHQSTHHVFAIYLPSAPSTSGPSPAHTTHNNRHRNNSHYHFFIYHQQITVTTSAVATQPLQLPPQPSHGCHHNN